MNIKPAWATEKDLLQNIKTNKKMEEKEKHKSQEERKEKCKPLFCLSQGEETGQWGKKG